MPICAGRYKLGLLCQLPKPSFEAKVPFGDNPCFLIRRLFVANFCTAFTGRLPFFARLFGRIAFMRCPVSIGAPPSSMRLEGRTKYPCLFSHSSRSLSGAATMWCLKDRLPYRYGSSYALVTNQGSVLWQSDKLAKRCG